MPKRNPHVPSQHPTRKTAEEITLRLTDLVELVLEPLASQIDRARIEILQRIQETNESTDMIAREMRREMNR